MTCEHAERNASVLHIRDVKKVAEHGCRITDIVAAQKPQFHDPVKSDDAKYDEYIDHSCLNASLRVFLCGSYPA